MEDLEIGIHSKEVRKELIGRNELVIFDTNAFLDLFYYSKTFVNEVFTALEDNLFEDDIFIPKKVFEEYGFGKKKIMNIHKDILERDKEQLLAIFENSIKNFSNYKNKKWDNYNIQILETVEKTKDILIDNKKLVSILINEYSQKLKDIFEVEKIIENNINLYNKNFDTIKILYNEDIGKLTNVWKSDIKKDNNKLGDAQIWQEILNIIGETKYKKILFIENERKSEWRNSSDPSKLNDVLLKSIEDIRKDVDFNIKTFEEFIIRYLPLSYDSFCEINGVNKLMILEKYRNISKFKELYNEFKIVIRYNDLKDDLIDSLNLELEIDERVQRIKFVDLKIKNFHQPNKNVQVKFSEYDEVRFNYCFNQRYEIEIYILLDEEPCCIIKNVIVEFYYVTDELFGKENAEIELKISSNLLGTFADYLKIPKKF